MSDPTSSNNGFFARLHLSPFKYWAPVAFLAWGGAVAALIIRGLLHPDRATNTDRYLRAGRAWMEGLPLYIYTPNKGFVYSPFAAICYAATAFFPDSIARIIWHLISAGLLMGGLMALMVAGPFSHIPRKLRGVVLLLVFPLALGNLDSAQANPIVIGLIMIAVAAASVERWWVAAIAVCGAVFWKVYPLAVGMLLVLVAPRKFSWKLAAVLLAMGLAPFLFQKPGYVADQYWLWYDTRTADNRLEYSLDIAPLDLWFFLVRAGHLPISPSAYRVLQLAAAAAVAVFCAWGAWKKWPKQRLLGGLFTLVCLWMALLGPASELHTYLLLAPAAALAVVESHTLRLPRASRVLAIVAYLFLLVAILRVAFIPKFKNELILSMQAMGGLVLLAYAIRRYVSNRDWKTAEAP